MSEKLLVEYDEYIDPGNWHWIAGPVDARTAAIVKAAPDLLEALELVMPWAAKAVADHYNQKVGQRALDAAHAAIAKARHID